MALYFDILPDAIKL